MIPETSIQTSKTVHNKLKLCESSSQGMRLVRLYWDWFINVGKKELLPLTFRFSLPFFVDNRNMTVFYGQQWKVYCNFHWLHFVFYLCKANTLVHHRYCAFAGHHVNPRAFSPHSNWTCKIACQIGGICRQWNGPNQCVANFVVPH